MNLRTYTLLLLLATTSALTGFSFNNFIIPTQKNAALSATIGIAAGAALATAGHYCYKKTAQWIFNLMQDHAAYNQALAQKMRVNTTYVLTVNLKNRTAPLKIKKSTRNTAAHSLDNKIQDTSLALAQQQPTITMQKVHDLGNGLYVMGKTIVKNPVLVAGFASLGALSYFLGKPNLKTGLALGGIATFTAASLTEKFIKEKKQTKNDLLISQAIQAILADARKNKNKHLEYTMHCDFSEGTCSIKRLGTLVLTHENVQQEIVIKLG